MLCEIIFLADDCSACTPLCTNLHAQLETNGIISEQEPCSAHMAVWLTKSTGIELIVKVNNFPKKTKYSPNGQVIDDCTHPTFSYSYPIGEWARANFQVTDYLTTSIMISQCYPSVYTIYHSHYIQYIHIFLLTH